MADFYELEKRYANIPSEIKRQKRWICYALKERNKESFKIPVAPFMDEKGSFVGVAPTDNSTWGDFDTALKFCADNNLEGLAFELYGSDVFAIDLDNRPDKSGNVLPQKAFQTMANEFCGVLNSYAEWSVSRQGVHILCYGSVPKDLPTIPAVEIYQGEKFFVMTGDTIRKAFVRECPPNQLKALMEKYAVKESREEKGYEVTFTELTDEQVFKCITSSKNKDKIRRLFYGDCSDYDNDKDKAKQALCNFLAYFSHCNEEQIKRLFAKSKLVDEEWPQQMDKMVTSAVNACAALGIKVNKPESLKVQKPAKAETVMNIDEDGEPIFHISDKIKLRKTYSLDDTGNAQRFLDYFGEHFHYNATDKAFMFWTGKTWIYDTKGIIRKYANELIKILSEEAEQIREQIAEEPNEDIKKRLVKTYDACQKNITRISNKAGKDAMLNELQFLSSIPVETTDFNKDPFLLNTDSGIVDLATGEILPFDRERLMSYNTKTKVSYEEPEEWLKFLHSIFTYDDPNDTEEVIECLRRCFGYTLTASVKEQCIFLLHGDGSNGKSTLLNVLQNIMGDYFNTIDSSQLMVTKNQSVAIQNSLAELIGTRFLSTQETEEGARLSEPIIKHISGDEVINAQKKYGKPFYFQPVFKLWMSTNCLPIIRGKDYGIWRRIFLFPFKRQFTEKEKDKEMPNKLAAEYDRILGWCIRGAVDYLKDLDLKRPSYLLNEVHTYQEELDTVLQFIGAECYPDKTKTAPKRAMYDAYKEWAKRSGLPALSEPKFKNEMIKKGYPLVINNNDHTQHYDGIMLVDTVTKPSKVFDDDDIKW